MGQNPVCYNYRATLISYRSCLKPVDTFRRLAVRVSVHASGESSDPPKEAFDK